MADEAPHPSFLSIDSEMRFRLKTFENGTIPHYLGQMIQEKRSVHLLEDELFDRLKTENEVRRLKRAGCQCPFDMEGLCRNIRIRCGERQQFATPEKDEDRKVPHQCNYRPVNAISGFNILVVDDDPDIRELCLDFLMTLGIPADNIDRAPGVQEAIECLKKGKIANRQYAMVITDVRMHQSLGYHLVNHMVERNFNARILIMSGFAENTDLPANYMGNAEIIPGEPVVRSFLKKPIYLSDLAGHVRAVQKELSVRRT